LALCGLTMTTTDIVHIVVVFCIVPHSRQVELAFDPFPFRSHYRADA
jgi:hypothetical protein